MTAAAAGVAPSAASDRLHDDVRALELAARRIMDSITGAWECEGSPYVPEMCSAAGTIIDATGRLGHALEKAALAIHDRAATCYIDRLGDRVDATERVKEIASDLLYVAQNLRDFRADAGRHVDALGSIGQRD